MHLLHRRFQKAQDKLQNSETSKIVGIVMMNRNTQSYLNTIAGLFLVTIRLNYKRLIL